MTRMHSARGLRAAPPLLLGSTLGALLAGCEFEPYASTDLTYDLSDVSKTRLADELGQNRADAAEAQVLGALEMLVGTPQAPQFLLTEAMLDEEFDPNYSAAVLSDEAWEEVLRDNRTRRFERQLALIEAGRYEDVPEPLYARDLWAEWTARVLPALLEDPEGTFESDDGEEVAWKDEAVDLFVRHYPTLRESAEMYRVQCLHCHGVEGGGDGPTSPYLDPPPRDYRHGKFKWVAVDRNDPPRREDLLRILREGATFTAMPSFARFSRGELEGLVDYVRMLAIRGQVEGMPPPRVPGQNWLSGGGLVDATLESEWGVLPPEAPIEVYERIWEKWRSAEENYVYFDGEVPRPAEMTAERIAHGRELFLGNVANCYTCHGERGRGDGESIWEEVAVEDADGELALDEDGQPAKVRRKRLDEWGNDSNPRNLQQGIFRGGGRPIDLYRRVKYGISGTIMPAAEAGLTDEDLWDIVYYVLSIAEEHDPARLQERRATAVAGAEGHGDDHGEAGGQ